MEIKESATENKETRGLPLWAIIMAFVVLFAFLILFAWGLRNAQKGPITIGQKVPPFELTTFDGDVLSTEDYAGQVIVVNFWASWCGPCELEAAEMEDAWRFYEKTGDVMFLGVDYVDTEPEAMKYLNKFDISYPNGPDLRTSISQMFRILGVPETYIIDRDGRLAYVKKGPFISLLEITNAIDGVLDSE
ncbi:MAG: TlpA family protein disulfide reductase [Anaerolineaceae bacterium]|nr:TlpA family protein disulfide reductase [Anaerolineaceae bacterium]